MKMYQVDAFTTQLFKGNSAAVLVLDNWLNEELMQNIAFENNLAETAFVRIIDDENMKSVGLHPAQKLIFAVMRP